MTARLLAAGVTRVFGNGAGVIDLDLEMEAAAPGPGSPRRGEIPLQTRSVPTT